MILRTWICCICSLYNEHHSWRPLVWMHLHLKWVSWLLPLYDHFNVPPLWCSHRYPTSIYSLVHTSHCPSNKYSRASSICSYCKCILCMLLLLSLLAWILHEKCLFWPFLQQLSQSSVVFALSSSLFLPEPLILDLWKGYFICLVFASE